MRRSLAHRATGSYEKCFPSAWRAAFARLKMSLSPFRTGLFRTRSMIYRSPYFSLNLKSYLSSMAVIFWASCG